MKEFVVMPEVDYSLVVHRLLGETEFWARDALLHLLHDNVFPSRYIHLDNIIIAWPEPYLFRSLVRVYPVC